MEIAIHSKIETAKQFLREVKQELKKGDLAHAERTLFREPPSSWLPSS